MRLGIFGGSFDPVHNGHLLLVDCCRKQAKLDEVWFVPTALQPHKPGGPIASECDRVAMLEAALVDRPGDVVSMIEIERGGVSYTVDTLREIHRQRPEAEIFLLMGADTLHDLPRWREAEAVLELAAPMVVHRAGEPQANFAVLANLVDQERLQAIEQSLVDMPASDVSSSEVRRRLAIGESICDLVPPPVQEFIIDSRLYAQDER